jgi:hypothetical protein
VIEFLLEELDHCGSGLARESGESLNESLEANTFPSPTKKAVSA